MNLGFRWREWRELAHKIAECSGGQQDTRWTPSDQNALFVNRHGQRLSVRSIRRKLDRYLTESGLDPSITPHTLRHAFAINMLNNGADLRSVQELLGHQSLATAQLYTHPTTPPLKAAHDDAHPESRSEDVRTEP